jgi:uridine kinase
MREERENKNYNQGAFSKMPVLNYSAASVNIVAKKILQIASENRKYKENTVVSICGGSSTGKSTHVTYDLHLKLQQHSIVVSQDDFLGKCDYNLEQSPYRWDDPDRYCLFDSCIVMRQLKSNVTSSMPEFSFQLKKQVGEKELKPAKIILFEGLYSGFRYLRNFSDYIIYVEMPLYARILRRLIRNLYERYQSTDATRIFESYLEAPLKAHNEFVVQQKDNADLILKMPFSFQDSIDRFHLKPSSPSTLLGDIVFEFFIDEATIITIRKIFSHYLLIVTHNALQYLSFPISHNSFDTLKAADLRSY